MEHNDTFFPQDAGRRRVLAKLLQIPPALQALADLEAVPEAYSCSMLVLANRSVHTNWFVVLKGLHSCLPTPTIMVKSLKNTARNAG
jgi:hypothetical protein